MTQLHRALLVIGILVLASAPARSGPAAQIAPALEYRVLATNRTATMEKEMNGAAQAGFRFRSVMGGETAIGGKEVVAVMARVSGASRYHYRLLATNRTSTMQRELQDAAEAGYEYRGQTVFETAFGGQEVVCILERDGEGKERSAVSYLLLATSRTGTLQKELNDAGAKGYDLVGLTVGKTAAGGSELVAITRRTAR
jgi:hypothetical protein